MPYKNSEDAKRNKKKYYQNGKEYFLNKSKEYYLSNRKKVLDRMKLYHIENREKRLEYLRNWNKKHKKESDKKYYEKNKSILYKKKQAYFHTEKGKICKSRTQARRKRDMKFVELFENPFPKDIKVHYHHINNILTIPIPQSIHIKTLGKNHRIKCNKIIDELYGINLDILFGV